MRPTFAFALFALSLLHASAVHACCALGRLGEPVVNADQTVLIIWDPQTKTEHFIRKASFKAEGDDFGFLVPTPSCPQLSESGNEAFPHLANITRPRVKPHASFGCSASQVAYAAPRSAVTVIERKDVAGFNAAVLSATSASALTDWLKTNGYYFSPEVEAWAAPYVRDGWMFTALKVAKRSTGETSVQAGALRISFTTERPLFPYREPDSRRDAKKSAHPRVCCASISSATRATPARSMGRAGPARRCGARRCPRLKRIRCSVNCVCLRTPARRNGGSLNSRINGPTGSHPATSTSRPQNPRKRSRDGLLHTTPARTFRSLSAWLSRAWCCCDGKRTKLPGQNLSLCRHPARCVASAP